MLSEVDRRTEAGTFPQTDAFYRKLPQYNIQSPEDNTKGVHATHKGCSRSRIWVLLLIDWTTQVKICFVCEQQKLSGGHFVEFPNIMLCEFQSVFRLVIVHFVWMHLKITVCSVLANFGKPKSLGLFKYRRTCRLLDGSS